MKMSMWTRLLAAGCNLIAVAFAVPAYAQSGGLNIDFDFNLPGESGTGAPADTYTAASTQAGFWNRVSFGTGPFALNGLGGTSSGATISRSLSTSAITFSTGASGNYALLINDGDAIATLTTYTISGLPAGAYSVFTYAAAPSISTVATRITIAGNPQTVASAPTDFTFAQGATHALHTVNLSGGALVISVNKASIQGIVNGIQIIPASVPTATITSPLSCSFVGGIIEVRGTASSPSLSSWVLQYTGGDVDSWFTIAAGSTSVTNGVLGNWNLTDSRPCGYTLRLLVYGASGPPIETLRSFVGAVPGDANLDGEVNFPDITFVLGSFGLLGP